MKSEIIYNNLIPFKGFSAINLFGTIYARIECKPLPERTVRHEMIHTAQANDFLLKWFAFYAVYLWYWIWFGYNKNPFEREAYGHDFYKRYTFVREKFAWKKYIKN